MQKMYFAYAQEICKFINYPITKYIKFQWSFDHCQIKLGLCLMEPVSEIVLYIVQEFL